jgi:hypothetical protein
MPGFRYPTPIILHPSRLDYAKHDNLQKVPSHDGFYVGPSVGAGGPDFEVDVEEVCQAKEGGFYGAFGWVFVREGAL